MGGWERGGGDGRGEGRKMGGGEIGKKWRGVKGG